MHYVIRIKSAGLLMMGDRVLTGGTTLEDGTVVDSEYLSTVKTRTVGSVKVGRVKVKVTDVDGRQMLYTELNTRVGVVRQEMTEEEQAARHEARVRESLEESLRDGLTNYHPTALLRRAADNMERYGQSGAMFRNVDQMLQGQALYDFYLRVQSVYEGDGSYAGDVLMAFAAVMARALDLTSHTFRPLSRSTSITGNIAEDLAKWAASQHLDGMMGGGDLLRRTMMEMQLRKLG